jgi:exopolysaccharide biosynthesis polyprenyl glycosylphosphotransferase
VIQYHARLLHLARLGADLLVLLGSFLLAWALRFHTSLIPRFAPIPPFGPYLALLGAILIIWTVVLQVGNAGVQRNHRPLADEIAALIQVHTFGMLLVFAVIFFIRPFTFSRVMIVLFWCLSTLGLVLERAAARGVARALARRGSGLRRILLVGTGPLGRQVLRTFQSRPELGYRFVGALTAGRAEVGDKLRRVPILGSYEDLERLASEHEIDLVILALAAAEQERMGEVLDHLGDAMVDVWVVPDFVRHVRLRGGVAQFEGLPLISLQASPLGGWNGILKRLLDLVLAAGCFLALSPLMLLIAAAVGLTSRGGVFYRQERMGLDGHRFQILKFRSMVVGAEKHGARFATADDPRVTRVGRLIRKTSLDELPQLFNILKGDMSLVGPRPERPVFIEDFRRHFPRYMLRHRVKAGMTGFAQVHGLRGNTSLEARLEHDLFYIENWSVWLDLKILLMTIPAVLRGKGTA